ncbi:hypothetical protein HK102_008671, partial [Quaeritorhiza haematococci]
HSPVDVQGKVARILGIWEERQVYSSDFIKGLKVLMGAISPTVGASSSTSVSVAGGGPAAAGVNNSNQQQRVGMGSAAPAGTVWFDELKKAQSLLDKITSLHASRTTAYDKVRAIPQRLFDNDAVLKTVTPDAETKASELSSSISQIDQLYMLYASEVENRNFLIAELKAVVARQEGAVRSHVAVMQEVKLKKQTLQYNLQSLTGSSSTGPPAPYTGAPLSDSYTPPHAPGQHPDEDDEYDPTTSLG